MIRIPEAAVRRALVVAAVGSMVSTAMAIPSISVTSPPPGPLYNVHPTITVVYSSDGPPLALDTLVVLVNGVDWTSRFTKTPTSASYTVAPPESLIAGQLTIAASIFDVNGGFASTSNQYEVFPKLVNRTPDSGFEGTLVTMQVEGLDPDPADNVVQFSGAATAMLTTNPATATGTVRVPLGAVTGPMSVKVNGKPSPETLPFTVSREFTKCGHIEKMISRIDGSMLIHYEAWGFGPPGCPSAPSWSRQVTLQSPGGPVQLLGLGTGAYNIAVEKNGMDFAVLINEGPPSSPQVRIRSTSRPERVIPGMHVNTYYSSVADFDPAGNLYFLAVGGPRVVKVTSSGAVSVIADLQFGQNEYANTLGLTCAGKGYIELLTHEGQGIYSGDILIFDLAAGRVVGRIPITGGGPTGTLAYDASLTGTEPFILGASMTDLDTNYDVDWWVSANEAPTSIVYSTRNPVDPKVTVAPSGEVYTVFESGSQAYIARLGYRVPPHPTTGRIQPYCPCPGPDCPSELRILDTTGRWKPQRDVTTNIRIEFASTDPLRKATVTLTGPSIVEPIEATFDPSNPPNPYVITWAGPWLTNPTDKRSFLARGEYRIKITGVRVDDSLVESAPNDPNSIISLVEVNSIVLLKDANDPRPLEPNPALPRIGDPEQGGQRPPQDRPPCDGQAAACGQRIFAEATSSGGQIFNRVVVKATVEPAVGNLRGQPPVQVHFRSFDVDDPAKNYGTLPDLFINYADADLDLLEWDVEDNWGVPFEGTMEPPLVQVPPAASFAQAVLRTNGQPGDNYRVLATTSDAWRARLRAWQPSQRGELRYCAPNPPQDCMPGGVLSQDETRAVSEMLTVWRTLHLEVDAMGPPPTDPAAPERNFIQASANSPYGVTKVHDPLPNGFPTQLQLDPDLTDPPVEIDDGSPQSPDGNGRFENGEIRLGVDEAAIESALLYNGRDFVRGIFTIPFVYTSPPSQANGFVFGWDKQTKVWELNTEIISVGVNAGTLRIGGVNWPAEVIEPKKVRALSTTLLPFRIVDDDATLPYVPQSHFLGGNNDNPQQNVLAQAYVHVTYAASTVTADFNRNIFLPPLGLCTDDLRGQLQAGRDPSSTTSPSYWFAYVQGAFQGDPFAVNPADPDDKSTDGDPDEEIWDGLVRGATCELNDEFGSLVFLESILDEVAHDPECGPLKARVSKNMAHELGHQLGIVDEDGYPGLMNREGCGIQPYFSDTSLRTIRMKNMPLGGELVTPGVEVK